MSEQFKRKASLLVVKPGEGQNPSSVIDLSELHFTFKTAQQDVESPNNCQVRVYNLSQQTVRSITTEEYSRVVVQAGYESGSFGVVFDGTIQQFRIGRENSTDSFLDILAADGDLAYNYSTVNVTLAAGSTPNQRLKAVLDEMAKKGVVAGNVPSFTGSILPRGKVLFGMAKALLRQEVKNLGATWNIDGGRVNVTPLDGYVPGEVLVLNAQTGLIGVPQQTEQGVLFSALLNPRLSVGNLVQIDNRSINKLVQRDPNAAPVAYNQYTGIQNLATIAADGLYRLYVVEHEGDTRGQSWYTNLVGLAVNPVTKKLVKP